MMPLTSRLLSLLAFAATVVTAQATTIDASRLLGTVSPAPPGAPGTELGYINTLINRYNLDLGDGTDAGLFFDLSPGALIPGTPLATAVDISATMNAPNHGTFDIDFTNYAWLYTRTGNLGSVYYIGDLTSIHTFDSSAPIGHYALARSSGGYVPPGGSNVPDGGSTNLLLGGSLIALALSRRNSRLVRAVA